MDLLRVAQEIATVVSTAGISVYPVLPDSADFPCAVVNPPDEIGYNLTFGGRTEVEMTVSVYAKSQDITSAWALLYSLLSFHLPDEPSSVVDALTNMAAYTHITGLNQIKASNFKSSEGTASADLSFTVSAINSLN